jgi:hypothetical protein
MNVLQVTGRLRVTDPKPIRMEYLSELVAKFDAPIRLVRDSHDGSFVVELKSLTALHTSEEAHFKDFLLAVGRELPGLLVGFFEVWWKLAVEAGPQRWELTENGELLIHESRIDWEEPHVYTG